MIISFNCSQGSVAVSAVSGALKCVDSNGTAITGVPVTAMAVTVSPTATTSPEAAFSDGLVLGWGVVAAMVAAYAITILRRAL